MSGHLIPRAGVGSLATPKPWWYTPETRGQWFFPEKEEKTRELERAFWWLFRRSPVMGILAPTVPGVSDLDPQRFNRMVLEGALFRADKPIIDPPVLDLARPYLAEAHDTTRQLWAPTRMTVPASPGQSLTTQVRHDEIAMEVTPDNRRRQLPLPYTLPRQFAQAPSAVRAAEQSHWFPQAYGPQLIPAQPWEPAWTSRSEESDIYSLEIRPVLTKRGTMQLLVRRQAPNRKRKEENRKRKDGKRGRRYYRLALHIINRTWGTYTEILDLWDALSWNIYTRRNTLAKPQRDAEGLLRGLMDGSLWLDVDGFIEDYAFQQLMDVTFAKLNRYQSNYGVMNRATMAGRPARMNKEDALQSLRPAQNDAPWIDLPDLRWSAV